MDLIPSFSVDHTRIVPGIFISRQDTVDAFLVSRDIRDKYLTSSLLWDLGLLEEAADRLPAE